MGCIFDDNSIHTCLFNHRASSNLERLVLWEGNMDVVITQQPAAANKRFPKFQMVLCVLFHYVLSGLLALPPLVVSNYLIYVVVIIVLYVGYRVTSKYSTRTSRWLQCLAVVGFRFALYHTVFLLIFSLYDPYSSGFLQLVLYAMAAPFAPAQTLRWLFALPLA